MYLFFHYNRHSLYRNIGTKTNTMSDNNLNKYLKENVVTWTDTFPTGTFQINCSAAKKQKKTTSGLALDLANQFMNSGTTTHLANTKIIESFGNRNNNGNNTMTYIFAVLICILILIINIQDL